MGALGNHTRANKEEINTAAGLRITHSSDYTDLRLSSSSLGGKNYKL